MGQYLVIYLTFKDAKRQDFGESCQQIARVIAYEFERHAFLMECPELSGERDKFGEIMAEHVSAGEIAK